MLAGALHFVVPVSYEAIMPPYLPYHRVLVYLSGAAEVGFGLLLFIPRYSRLAAWGIIATLLAIYPANIHHALSGGIDDPDLPPIMASATFAWCRLPFQLLFIAWAWWFARKD